LGGREGITQILVGINPLEDKIGYNRTSPKEVVHDKTDTTKKHMMRERIACNGAAYGQRERRSNKKIRSRKFKK
jgi:hypothetical protein